MYVSEDIQPKIGIISLTDTQRAVAHGDTRENTLFENHVDFKKYLKKSRIDLIDAVDHFKPQVGRVGLCTSIDIQKAVDVFLSKHVEAVIVGCWHWSEPMLIVELVRSLDKPILLYTRDDPSWAGTCLLSAAGASMWETAPNRAAQVHERVYDDKEAVVKWVRGVCALEKMRRGSILLWGGSYAVRMEYLQDDYPKLKSFLIGDVLTEDQYVLIRYAENVSEQRIDTFVRWLQDGGTHIHFDGKIFTPEIIKKQAALYLGAKDRILAMGDKFIGISVKCYYELSEVFGIDPCFIPAFMPYNEDSEGKKRTIPTVCEGDIKGLLSSIMLSTIAEGTPALFGDITYIGKTYMIISNCGASSVYYACNSFNTGEMLKNIMLEANCEGVSGGAVGYACPPGRMTLARLIRVKGKYFMHAGHADAIQITDAIKSKFYYGRTWPHTALQMNIDPQLLVKALGANHLSAISGDYIEEIRHFCKQAGIELFRIDQNNGLERWLERVHLME